MGYSTGDLKNRDERIERGHALLKRLVAMPVTFVAFFARAGLAAGMTLHHLRHGRALSSDSLAVIEQTLQLLEREGAETFTAKAERCARFTAQAEQRMREQGGDVHAPTVFFSPSAVDPTGSDDIGGSDRG